MRLPSWHGQFLLLSFRLADADPGACFVFARLLGATGAGQEAGRAVWGGDGPPGLAGYALTACFWSLLVTWMLRGLAASRTGMVSVSTPTA